MSATKQFDGSRRHVLDWVQTPAFLDTVREWVKAQSVIIPADTQWMPKSWTDPTESRLFNSSSPFLSANQKAELQRWWLVHSGNVPNWDLVVAGITETRERALVLLEAKAYSDEFDCGPKPPPDRESADAQERSIQNHEQIRRAINEAAFALSRFHSGITISRDRCYQLANRIATAWKLASMGIANTLVFLGFTGDREIASEGRYFGDASHWQRAFADYASSSFPLELLGQEISCGAASFRVITRSLPVVRSSRPIAERRRRG